MTEQRAEVEELLADYRRSRQELASVQQRLAAIRETASSQDGVVSATVGARGTLTALVLAENAYRVHQPAQLATLIVEVVGEATARALNAAGEVLAPALPAGTDPQALLLGTADLSEDEIAPSRAPAPREQESFEERSWVRPRRRTRSG